MKEKKEKKNLGHYQVNFSVSIESCSLQEHSLRPSHSVHTDWESGGQSRPELISRERQAIGQALQAGGCCHWVAESTEETDRWGEMAFATVNSASRSTQEQVFIWMNVFFSLH